VRLSQIILLPLAAGIVVLIFFLGRTRFTPDAEGNMKNMPKPMMGSASASTEAIGFGHVLTMAVGSISPLMKDSVNQLTGAAEKASGAQKEKLLKQLAGVWARTGNFICAGHYFKSAAEVNNSVTDWKEAASILELSFGSAADSVAKEYAINEAINCYQQVVKDDSTDLNSKVQLALCYIDGKGAIMNGVLLLKDVEKKDSDNQIMNLTLGRLAVVSGQLDKAIGRLEKLVKNHPDNADAYYYLAEAYRADGRKDDAVKMLEKCKTMMAGSPEAIKQIEQLINDIKKS
jgi:tetratricopeptide (TPR) repeat protein